MKPVAEQAVNHQREEADEGVGPDAVRQAVVHRRDLESVLDHAEAPLDVPELLVLRDQRRRGHTRNLVVAATGTGKTVVAALDYQRLSRLHGPLRLLVVAHRREILDQSLAMFRAVLADVPLSIRTAAGGPYDDAFGPDDLLRYRYRGTDPNHTDNAGLRRAIARKLPLVYLHGIVRGKYLAVWPVYVVGDGPAALTFTVAVDDPGARRRYITSSVRARLHKRGFRERVLDAYHQQCALCRLRHEELLDAAHIIPDSEEGGDPVVRNGLALCKLHHAAFDAYFLAVRPDYTVEVRRSILDEHGGPMLLHGLQGLHNTRIWHPRSPTHFPDPNLLVRRCKRFKKVV
jgi:putative restriction endonuclease